MASTSSGARTDEIARGVSFSASVRLSFSASPGLTFTGPGASMRVLLALEPGGRGDLSRQLEEILSAMQAKLEKVPKPVAIIMLTIFLRDPGDLKECKRMLAAHYGPEPPVTSYVFQPPCSGAALAIEVCAVGGGSVSAERFGARTLALSCDGARQVYYAGAAPEGAGSAYGQTLHALEEMRLALKAAGTGFENVVRTWFYLGGITERESGTDRYRELNRARTDFYRDIRFRPSQGRWTESAFPSSTCIGAEGSGLAAGCFTFETKRKEVLLLPLENPLQTPAYSYRSAYSAQSPKFSRAMSLVLGGRVTAWVSGTASIVDSESRHHGDAERQTMQTIDNIERLVSGENFSSHGVTGVNGSLGDFRGIRVYIKRPEDFMRCKAVCESRFGPVPAIYAVADVCRPELLVEIEGVASFTRSRGASGE